MHALRQGLAVDTIYPTIADDQMGGLVAEWRADMRRITVDVDSDGDLLISVHGAKGQLLYRGESLSELRRHLRDFTAYVSNANPGWRALFRSGREFTER
ncbi:hypothetical protein DX116_00360 [Aeromicrobium endophyticum]|uniref:Uncharacterized protein n=1 Tax=Aeromicrobium endophyticum TaxID=2292704 RepID=A0A371P8A7_9ACTN|nr:hypothetical protein DX116_00360 [Aeromicrobium endophyticum]